MGAGLYKDGHINHSFSSAADIARLTGRGNDPSGDNGGARNDPTGRGRQQGVTRTESAPVNPTNKGHGGQGGVPISRGHDLSAAIRGQDYHPHHHRGRHRPPPLTAPPNTTAFHFPDLSLDEGLLGPMGNTEEDCQSERGFFNPGAPLLGNNSSSEDNILVGSQLPNGVLILSPNGDVFARDNSGKSVLVRPKALASFKNFTTNLPQSMKTLPLKDNRVKSSIFSRSRTLDPTNDDTITNDIEPGGVNLDQLTKEQIYQLWRVSESELNNQLRQALEEKAELEQKLAMIKPGEEEEQQDEENT